MICSRVLIIHQGKIVAEDTPQNLAQNLQGVEQLQLEVGGPSAEVIPVLRQVAGVNEVTHRPQQNRDIYLIRVNSGQDLRDEISRAIVSNGWSLLSMHAVSMSLEDIFLRLTTHEEL